MIDQNDAFWSKVDITDENSCWEWKAYKNRRGYGCFHVPGTFSDSVLAHRYAYQQTNGEIPEGLIVLHSCDNPPCCNPKHHRLGDRIDNNKDMRAKGRGKNPPLHRGTSHPKSKFTDEQLENIRNDLRSAKLVASDYGVHYATIYRIRQGKTYESF